MVNNDGLDIRTIVTSVAPAQELMPVPCRTCGGRGRHTGEGHPYVPRTVKPQLRRG